MLHVLLLQFGALSVSYGLFVLINAKGLSIGRPPKVRGITRVIGPQAKMSAVLYGGGRLALDGGWLAPWGYRFYQHEMRRRNRCFLDERGLLLSLLALGLVGCFASSGRERMLDHLSCHGYAASYLVCKVSCPMRRLCLSRTEDLSRGSTD